MSNITTNSDVLSRNRGRKLAKTFIFLNVVLFILTLIMTFPIIITDFTTISDEWLTTNFGLTKSNTSSGLNVLANNVFYTLGYLFLYIYEFVSLIFLIAKKSYSKICIALIPPAVIVISFVFPITQMGIFNGGTNTGAVFNLQGILVYIILNLIYFAVIYLTVGFISNNKDMAPLFASDKVKFQRMREEMNDYIAEEQAENAQNEEVKTETEAETETEAVESDTEEKA